MKRIQGLAAAAALSFIATLPAYAADAVKIGMITTLSGGGASLGVDIRDGFELALKQKNGMLGGVATELTVVDDARKVENAKQIATRMIKQDDVDVVTGIVWSNLAMAVVPSVTRAGKVYISPNAGPSDLAGKGCDANYFNVAWQNDNLHEAMGQYVTDKGFKNVYLMAPNYPAGKDALAGFKRYYKGAVAAEVYTKLGQVDYAAEIANLRAAKPDAVFFFLPGGMGINFVKQYAQAGLTQDVPLFGPAFSFDEGILKAVGDAAIGTFNTSQYSHDLDNAANTAFASAFVEAYGRKPSLYASQGYDAAMLLDSAIAKVGGNVKDGDAFRAALKAADFTSVRGAFKFGPNQHPVQDIYVREVVKDGEGVTNRLVGKVFTDHADAYAADCKM
ncbi:ABC transporter substrate-binding protein [Magnetovibrio sp.]|uniref:ABC transporter substrate-binding protein n=1 Tax=Magnetovibrio sp. TaxID=2024836 RepID=UPI002F944D8D